MALPIGTRLIENELNNSHDAPSPHGLCTNSLFVFSAGFHDGASFELLVMKKLELNFRKDGFDYEQVERVGDVAIYRQSKAGQVGNVHFEVGKIRENKAREVFGKHFEASESWPSSEEWGIRAWTYRDLTSAKRRLATLTPPNSANP